MDGHDGHGRARTGTDGRCITGAGSKCGFQRTLEGSSTVSVSDCIRMSGCDPRRPIAISSSSSRRWPDTDSKNEPGRRRAVASPTSTVVAAVAAAVAVASAAAAAARPITAAQADITATLVVPLPEPTPPERRRCQCHRPIRHHRRRHSSRRSRSSRHSRPSVAAARATARCQPCHRSGRSQRATATATQPPPSCPPSSPPELPWPTRRRSTRCPAAARAAAHQQVRRRNKVCRRPTLASASSTHDAATC
jgi:hypothetical protein